MKLPGILLPGAATLKPGALPVALSPYNGSRSLSYCLNGATSFGVAIKLLRHPRGGG